MITPIVAALFGSSMVMVSGPTTAISAIVFSSISGITPPGSAEFFQIAVLLAVIVGAIQLCFACSGWVVWLPSCRTRSCWVLPQLPQC